MSSNTVVGATTPNAEDCVMEPVSGGRYVKVTLPNGRMGVGVTKEAAILEAEQPLETTRDKRFARSIVITTMPANLSTNTTVDAGFAAAEERVAFVREAITAYLEPFYGIEIK